SLHSRFRDRGLALDYTDLADHAVVMGVEALETILGNLFENSLQHQASCVHLRAMRRGQTLQLTLHDNGTGISAANRERIFTPFFTTRRNTGGTGLGLEITASLLRAHGGHICLGHSEQGACFILTLNAGFP
ncbi:MAG TPA: HAMP domain-containing sensor histidine kinase, partial [Thiolinea sp.]|nr:HAMP domain-containing sensor histidine kinase [Thiolinea sp.]